MALTKLVDALPASLKEQQKTLLELLLFNEREGGEQLRDLSNIFQVIAMGWVTHTRIRLSYTPPPAKVSRASLIPTCSRRGIDLGEDIESALKGLQDHLSGQSRRGIDLGEEQGILARVCYEKAGIKSIQKLSLLFIWNMLVFQRIVERHVSEIV